MENENRIYKYDFEPIRHEFESGDMLFISHGIESDKNKIYDALVTRYETADLKISLVWHFDAKHGNHIKELYENGRYGDLIKKSIYYSQEFSDDQTKNIKVNYTNSEGKRTSTTINYKISEFYCNKVLGIDFHWNTRGEEKRQVIAESITNLLKQKQFHSKDFIEYYLLEAIHEAPKSTENS